MEIRFNLDEQIDAKLIKKIRDRAGHSHLGRVAKIMLIEYSFHEDMMKLGVNRQKEGSNTADSMLNSGELDLDSFDNLLDDL